MSDDTQQTVSRKWKLTVAMVVLYTAIYGFVFIVGSVLLIKNVIPADIWKETSVSYIAMWSYAVFAVSGWYLGMNVIQKWAPFPGSGVK